MRSDCMFHLTELFRCGQDDYDAVTMFKDVYIKSLHHDDEDSFSL